MLELFINLIFLINPISFLTLKQETLEYKKILLCWHSVSNVSNEEIILTSMMSSPMAQRCCLCGKCGNSGSLGWRWKPYPIAASSCERPGGPRPPPSSVEPSSFIGPSAIYLYVWVCVWECVFVWVCVYATRIIHRLMVTLMMVVMMTMMVVQVRWWQTGNAYAGNNANRKER